MEQQMQMQFPLARRTDPSTSHAAAAGVKMRAGSQQHRLLHAYSTADMTDEEAAGATGLPHAWKRCSDLRNAGLIEPTGATRPSSMGQQQRVCRITAAGLERLRV